MKNSILSLTALALFTLAFSSCKKDPTFQEQIIGHWKSIEVKAGANDLTSTNTFDLRLQSSKEFDLEVTAIVPLTGSVTKIYDGDWTLDNVKQDLTLIYNGSDERKTWDITSVSDLGMTAEMLENNIRYKVKFVRQ